MASRSSVALSFALLAVTFAAATNVDQCPGESIEDLNSRVHLIPCKRLPCHLKKGKDQHITIEFTPETDTKDIKNSVSAEIFGVPLPFVGVDGNSICDKVMFTESGEAASCPLKAGTSYTYKDSFPVYNFYPSTSLTVNWALKDSRNKNVICFTVPARIG